MDDCLFCKIIAGEIPSDQVYTDEHCIAFKDIQPKAKTHLLIVPRKHIASVLDSEDEDQSLMGHLIQTTKVIAKKMGLTGYRLQINVGKSGGQEVFHLHVHLMASH